jgi:cytoplasmic iron level regulating protein YaaA (DUF328/UPF0246 family)
MIAIISPAKSFSKEVAAPELEYSQPVQLEQSEKLISKLKSLSKKKFAGLMNLSDDLANLNMERHANWGPPFTEANADPAIFAFNGEVYRGLEATSLSEEDLSYAQDHLRILSGLYGCLKPMDLI